MAHSDVSRRFKPLAAAKASNIPVLGRTRFIAGLQGAAVAAAGKTAESKRSAAAKVSLPSLALYLFNIRWVAKYLAEIFRPKFRPYPTYGPENGGIYLMQSSRSDGKVTVSLVGDWATGTKEANQVSEQVRQFAPDYSIHLGDVYFMGDNAEVDENFIGKHDASCPYDPVCFPRGAVGTLALPGNHDLYSGGKPYFTRIVGAQGYCRVDQNAKQTASFFCLESPEWRILGIDTGYNSVGKAFLGLIPWINKIPWVGADCALEPELIDWINVNVNPQQKKKPTILLSHHQYYSVYEGAYTKPARQLANAFAGQGIVWIWGHEHRLSIYENWSPDQQIKCYGRCLGNGGMPVKGEDASNHKSPLAYFDPRGMVPPDGSKGARYEIDTNDYAGWNGFANLTLEGYKLSIDYRDLTGQSLFREEFTGHTDGSLTNNVVSSPVLQRV
jgi:hypothetical protein